MVSFAEAGSLYNTHMGSGKELTPGFLFRGTFFAAVQAWHLLSDASLLYENTRYANSFVLAVYSIEEIGRSRIYLQHTSGTLQGSGVILKTLKKECENHIAKLEQGRNPMTVSVSIGGAVGPGWRPPAPGSLEEKELFRQFTERRKLCEKQLPHETHAKRFQALYVDPLDSTWTWNVPSEVGESDAWEMCVAAAIGYDHHRTRLSSVRNEPEFREMASQIALPELPETIVLPDPL